MTFAKSSRLIVPPFLEPGDTIGIATPASLYDRELFEAGLAILRQWGYSPQLGRRGIRKKRYLAGSDSERAEELMDLFQDPEIKAILCARGGYGAMRLLDRLDYRVLSRRPKMFIGFSDITVLLLACFRSGPPADLPRAHGHHPGPSDGGVPGPISFHPEGDFFGIPAASPAGQDQRRSGRRIAAGRKFEPPGAPDRDPL